MSTLPSIETIGRQFLNIWEFCDYAELSHLKTGKGLPGNSTWQSFEFFCQHFRILRSIGFGEKQEAPLEQLHSGCMLRDDSKKIIVNRHLDEANASHQYYTDSKKGAQELRLCSTECWTQKPSCLTLLSTPAARPPEIFP